MNDQVGDTDSGEPLVIVYHKTIRIHSCWL